MKYLYNTRRFAIDVLPHIKEQLDEEQLGVFGDTYKLPHEEDEDDTEVDREQKKQEKYKRFYKKINSLHFPISWQETIVNTMNLYLLEGLIQSVEEGNTKLENLRSFDP